MTFARETEKISMHLRNQNQSGGPMLVLLVCIPLFAFATAVHEYVPDEYVTIAKGVSPDGRMAITAHGEGEYGDRNFHLYLTDAVTGRHIGPLEEVRSTLDSKAGAFAATRSEDCGTVTIVWRCSRHAPFKAITYEITPTRAFPKTSATVDADELGEFWSDNCAQNKPAEKIFGTPKHN